MTDRPHRGPIDYERLGKHLRTLSVPTRILLLEKLQWPKTAAEIELPPFRSSRDHRSDRPISRQAVEKHLRALQEPGLVRTRTSQRDGEPVREYVVNPSRLFVVVDELRRLAKLRPPPGLTGSPSQTQDQTPPIEPTEADPALPEGDALVLVSGPSEGTAFPLEGSGPWTIGRSKEVDVTIPFDPYISDRNSEIVLDGGSFLFRDLPSSSNGTTLNWRLLEAREKAMLNPGDTLGVGRSLLVLRQA